jgi:hypothetical protein
MLFRAHLAPGDLAVGVGVQADRGVEVAQRDIPLAGERGAIALQGR